MLDELEMAARKKLEREETLIRDLYKLLLTFLYLMLAPLQWEGLFTRFNLMFYQLFVSVQPWLRV